MSYQLAKTQTVGVATIHSPGAFAQTRPSPAKARPHGEPAEYARRRQADTNRSLYGQLIEENTALGRITEFEQRSEHRIKQNTIIKIAREFKEKDKEGLRKRQERLAVLLAKDEEIYKQEIAKSQETTQQRAQRRALEARKSKESREETRILLAQELYNQQWRSSCDDLRVLDSKQIMKNVVKKLDEQSEENAKLRKAQENADEIYVKQFERDNARMEAQSKEEARQRRQANLDAGAELDRMIQTRRQFNQNLNAEIAAEREALRIQTLQDNEDLRLQKLRDQQATAQRMEQIRHFNEDLGNARKEAALLEKQSEARDMAQKLENFRREGVQQLENKNQSAKSIREYQDYLAARKREEAEMERQLEVLIEEENRKKHAKEDLVWEKQRLERENLMRDVLHQRDEQLLEKERAKLANVENRKLINVQVAEELAAEAELDRRDSQRRLDRARERISGYDKQIEEARVKREITKAQERQEFQKTQQAEVNYAAFLEREKLKTDVNGYVPRNFGLKTGKWE